MSGINIFSPGREYRYTLWRENLQAQRDLLEGVTGREGLYCQFIGLNPSTADEKSDDPTLRKCMKFARAWGYGAVCMTNLFAFRATQPVDMKKAVDPVGPVNNECLVEIASSAALIVAAWGKDGNYRERADMVQLLLCDYPLHVLRLNGDGSPEHPLYIPDSTLPIIWDSRQTASS